MKVFLDLDGVLVNFIKGACRVHKRDYDEVIKNWPVGNYDMVSYLGLTVDEFWEPLNNHNFWATLPWMDDGKDILKLIEDYFGEDNIAICTSPSSSPESASGKVEWIQREMPEYSRRFFIGSSKHFCAHEDAFLVDDAEHNVNLFDEHGGESFLYPRLWNGRHKTKNDALVLLEDFVEDLLGE